MISKYNGTCSICGKPTKAGKDSYDLDTKESYHEDCRNKFDLFSLSEAEDLADKLGYRRFTWDDLRDGMDVGGNSGVVE